MTRRAVTLTRPVVTGNPLTGVSLGALRLGATFRKIDIELPFTETSGTLSRAVATIAPVSDPTDVRTLLDLWETRPSAAQAAAYGAIIDCAENTAYQVRVTALDATGGTQVIIGTVTTRAESTIPTFSGLTPTHFVRTDGNNANLGTADTAGGAWLTLDYAWTNAPDGAIVKVGAGAFARTAETSQSAPTGRATAVTFLATNPIVNDARTRINAGSETWIVPPTTRRTSPTASGGPNAGVWSDAGSGWWEWASGVTGATNLFTAGLWSATEFGEMREIAHWDRFGLLLADSTNAKTLIDTNLSYNYGFYTATTGVISLKLPGGTDPNTLWLTFRSGEAAFAPTGPDIRFHGFGFRGFKLAVSATGDNAVRTIMDHCFVEGAFAGFFSVGSTPLSGGDHVVQYTSIKDRGLREVDGAVAGLDVVPWRFVKHYILEADSTDYSHQDLGHNLENAGISGITQHARIVVRHCTVDGTFDGTSLIGTPPTDRYRGYAFEVHDCTFLNLADDTFEPEATNCVNHAYYDNVSRYALVGISIGPIAFGPVYCLRNTFWRWGDAGLRELDAGDEGLDGSLIKYGSESLPTGRLFFLHNTCWTDTAGTTGADSYAGADGNDESLYLANNIIRTAFYANAMPRVGSPGDGIQVEKYNLMATSDAARGVRDHPSGTIYKTAAEFLSYRAAGDGFGVGSNEVSGVVQAANAVGWLEALLTSPTTGDLSLTVAAQSQVVGVVLPGVNDDLGRTPRIGFEP
jgi:hypothetical protein